MNNKRGFTLTELLAVIVILGIIAAIGVASYINISDVIKENQFTNVINNITSKIDNYAKDNEIIGVHYVTIDTLINEGYIQADDSKGYIYDPRDESKKLNCYVFKVIYENGNYKITTEEDKSVDLDLDSCPVTNNNNTNDTSILCNNVKCKSDWYKLDSIELKSQIPADTVLNNATVEWSSSLGDYEIFTNITNLNDGVFTVNSSSEVHEAIYYVTITNNTSDKKEVFKANVMIRIDNEAPKVVITESSENNESIDILISDLGAGDNEQQLVDSNGACIEENYIKENITITEPGEYKVCAKDSLGNISETIINVGVITFDYNDAPGYDSVDKLYIIGDNDIILDEPKRNGYEFIGWSTTENNSGLTNDLSKVYSGTTLYAQWKFDDRRINITKYNGANEATSVESHVIFVLDDSGSMAGSGITALKSSVTSLMTNAEFSDGTIFSMISFGLSSNVLGSYLTEKNDVINLLSNLRAAGGTNFDAGLQSAINIITASGVPDDFDKDNTFIIFLSDGFPNNYNDGIDKANILKANYVNKIYTIGLGSNASRTSLEKISSFNSETGQFYYYSSSLGADALTEVFRNIEVDIIRTGMVMSENGLILTESIVVDETRPFTIENTDTKEKLLETINYDDILIFLMNDGRDINLEAIDEYFKLIGNFDDIKITYYYEEE